MRQSDFKKSKLLVPAKATYDNRPMTVPPPDSLHEFLETPMSTSDPECLCWIEHLERSCCAFSLERLPGGLVMLYCHRIVGGRYWCCDPGRPTVRVGKRRRSLEPVGNRKSA